MKKFVMLVLILVISNAYEIRFEKFFEKSLEPDILATRVSISIKQGSEEKVVKKLNIFDDFFKKNAFVILKNGSYDISPDYKYTKNETKFVGFSGRMGYDIQTKNAKDMNRFISNLLKAKKGNDLDDIKIKISHVNWQISKKTYKEELEKLRMEAIIWANSYTKELSSRLQTKCELKKVLIDQSPRYYARALTSYGAKASANVAPIKTQEQVNINPSFEIECK